MDARYMLVVDFQYPCGFHIFGTLESAKAFFEYHFGSMAQPPATIRKVRYRKGHTIGTEKYGDTEFRVIVAKEIYVYPEHVKKKLEPELKETVESERDAELVNV